MVNDPNHRVKCSCTVSQLHEAGLKFEVHQGKGIFELECSKGVFKIPVIAINGLTEIMLRNLVAFDQCHHSFMKCYVTNHTTLLYNLIKTGKDVEILAEKGIMGNILGENKDVVATMIIELAQNTLTGANNANYRDVYVELGEFYNNRYHKYKATFVHDYWSTPWEIISLFGGILLLSLILIQTVCSIITLFKK
ncbi:putative UPF0481 protein At3g02645 [Prosopis cineraria]|uniref:putative UPF0481 protein At3g02645 n=1 Tax=Prosopis cineraria TaxID=364024 RepID=UPI00240F7BC4|nr:putative UPF0481 protein At3g02645 [Prosopis cineraria]